MVETYLIPMLQSAVYLVVAFLLLVVAKFAYGLLYRRVDLKEELFVQKNSALAVALGGCGAAAKSGDEIGRLAASLVAGADWPNPHLPAGLFAPRVR